jgi:Rrf2 family protein
MIFSKATGYGIKALAYMASKPERGLFGLQEIAEHEDIPPAYLRKVLGELRRHRYLRSVKGIHGGYALGRAAEAITLWEVFSLLEADPYMDMCILGNKVCSPESSCAFHDDWQRVRKELVTLMQNRTIAEAAAEISKPRELGNSPQNEAVAGKYDEPQKDENHGNWNPA